MIDKIKSALKQLGYDAPVQHIIENLLNQNNFDMEKALSSYIKF